MIAAYSDVDGTLTDTTIVSPLIWLKRRLMPPVPRALWLAGLPVRGLNWWRLDRVDRSASNRAIYANYRGLPVARTTALAEQAYHELIRPKLFPRAQERLEKFRREGVRIVLVTGGLDLFMQPMAREFGADCIAPGLVAHDGFFTGEMAVPPLTAERKAEAVRQHAREHGVDLEKSFALGDAFGDLAMLECVGRPIAVNPDSRLAPIAAARSWPVENWR